MYLGAGLLYRRVKQLQTRIFLVLMLALSVLTMLPSPAGKPGELSAAWDSTRVHSGSETIQAVC